MISAWSVGWKAKSRGIIEIAASLRIGLDAILYLDDNASELAEVTAALPKVSLLHAADPVETARALTFYPGLNGYETGEADRLRALIWPWRRRARAVHIHTSNLYTSSSAFQWIRFTSMRAYTTFPS
jgi:predicted enzyme involved in methoxymalonyl-ACP biosynthesis